MGAPTLIPEEQIQNVGVREFAAEARRFLSAKQWCRSVSDCRLAFAIAGMIGIFKADIEAAAPDVDPSVWVVVGDLPSAYLYYEPGDTWRDALAGYCYEMQRWIDATKTGASVQDLIPVNVPPTPEHAAMLSGRLELLRKRLLGASEAALESDV